MGEIPKIPDDMKLWGTDKDPMLVSTTDPATREQLRLAREKARVLMEKQVEQTMQKIEGIDRKIVDNLRRSEERIRSKFAETPPLQRRSYLDFARSTLAKLNPALNTVIDDLEQQL